MTDTASQNLLQDFVPQDDWSEEHKVSPRTTKRYRDQGLPWTLFGGAVHIGPADEARAWLLKRVRRTSGGAK